MDATSSYHLIFSSFTSHQSLFTTHHSPFTIHHSPLADKLQHFILPLIHKSSHLSKDIGFGEIAPYI